MKISILIITVVLASITSCKKEVIPPEPPYIEQWWDEYYGTYTVFDTANEITYQMEIKQIERYFDGHIFKDTLSVINVANKFEIGRTFQQNVNYIGGINLGFNDPAIDKDGQRWTFGASLREKENNDTFELVYSIANAQYYIEDNVPFYQYVFWTDLAVKNE